MLSVVRDRGRVAARGDLAGRAEILRRRRRAQRRVVAVPQRDIVRAQHTFHRVGQVLRLQIGELALLRAQFHVEQVVVDLRNQALQRNAALHAGRRHQRGVMLRGSTKPAVARIRDRRLFEEARRMAGRRNLLDALAEHAAAANQVGDLRLVERDLNRAGPDVICCRVDIEKLCVHGFFLSLSKEQSLLQNKKRAAAA